MGSRRILIIRATPRTGSNLLMCSLQQHPEVVSAGEIAVTSRMDCWDSLKDHWNLCKTCYLDPLPVEDAKTVCLFREDKKAQLESYRKACRTGEWMHGMPLNKIKPVANFLELVEETFWAIAPQSDLVVSYESLVNRWEKTIETILDIWGMEKRPIAKAIQKQ